MKNKAMINHIYFLFKNGLKVLSSGVITSFCLIVLTSGKWVYISHETSVFFINFYQWELLGLTLCKMGLDQIVFSKIISNQGYLDSGKFFLLRSFPVLVLYATVLLFFNILNIQFVLLLVICVSLDFFSIIAISKFNAKKEFTLVSVANLLNYPMFFLVAFCISMIFKISSLYLIVLFVLSSLVRFLFTNLNSEYDQHEKRYFPQDNLLLPFQQVLNYFIFKTDQIIVGIDDGMNTNFLSDEFKKKILLLTRIPEIYTGLTLTLTPLFYQIIPKINRIPDRVKLTIILSCISVVFLGIYTFSNFLFSDKSNISISIAYTLQVIFILPSNILTLKAFEKENIIKIIKASSLSVIIGITSLGVILFYFDKMEIVPYIVFIQLFIYVYVLSIYLKRQTEN